MVRYFILIVASIFLNACGKKGPVESLEPSDYPRTYPKPSIELTPQKKVEKKEASHDT
jgi:predicted small lipoprotein YifL